eukprot:TRINITY_DN125367_c0_g1_i1.p1 TRINITY_DN125367_c0_g1~~TRINITY_DN125367_c0_g1_i1.p1  ORF type:complete len:302 (+),score=14.51 TRINITY_DN125367_c0_g1_i1:223-1128(+)
MHMRAAVLHGLLVAGLCLFGDATSPAARTESLGDVVARLAEGASSAELDAAIDALLVARRRLAASSDAQTALPPVLYAHKHAYATRDPNAAADFVMKYLGAVEPARLNHSCPASYGPVPGEPDIRSLTLNGSSFVLHFIYNPLKAALFPHWNATQFGQAVDVLRGSRWAARGGAYGAGHFDQFMDNHIGLAVASLDPYVRLWESAGVPYICRTWCCAPGMPQWPQRCPTYSYNRQHGCEVGCYVEIPAGIILELQCGFTTEDPDGQYNASLACLTHVQPEIFDLCMDERSEQLAGLSDVQV